MSEPKNGERRIVSVVGLIVWRWGMAAGTLIAAYGVMWVKINAPSREQFQALTSQVQGLREDMIRAERIKDGVDELKHKLDRLDDRLSEVERRVPPRRPQAIP